MLDLSVFIHTKKELKLNRKVKRDTIDRGYELKHVLYMQENHVKPSYKKYIKPFRHEADIVIPNNERGFEKGLELISVLIKSKQSAR
jgi:uridine kinase